MPLYHTMLFDADNTLFDFSAAARAAFAQMLQLFGILPTKELIPTYRLEALEATVPPLLT